MKKGCQLIRFILIFNFQLLISNCFAQTDSLQVDSFEVHSINGKDYYIHEVKQGESLYAIHKKYDIPITVLKKENPSVIDGLSIGEKVFVPIRKNIAFEVKTDGNFITHIVEKKQTLYGIAKRYEVPQKTIMAANPTLVDGLKEGQEIKIPVVGLKKEKPPVVSVKYLEHPTHTVQEGGTLYSLSKLYNITIDTIKMLNGGLEEGLKAGSTIFIPQHALPNHNNTIKADSSINDTIRQWGNGMIDSLLINKKGIHKKEYTIALLLPFYLDANDEMIENKGILEKERIYPRSKFAIEFFNGVKMALDTISSDSCKFKLRVYDTNGDDTLRVKKILQQLSADTVDLILGPLYFDNFRLTAAFALQNQIPIVSPVKQSNKLLLGNPFIFKAIPSKTTTLKEICNMVADSFKTENLLAIAHNTSKEQELIAPYIQTYNHQILSVDDTTLYASIKTIAVDQDITVVLSHLRADQNNVIFVPSTNQTFITKLFSFLATTLNQKKYENYNITLLGLEEWVGFENIELSYFQKLNVHYCTTQHINFEDAEVDKFIKKSIDQEKVYPSKNTFLGFDLAYFLGKNLTEKGTLFSENLSNTFKGLSINLSFLKTGVESGFENTNSFLLRFDDFTLKRVH